jgi:hypothetical protein
VLTAGARYVVALPALPPPLGEEVVRILARHLQQGSTARRNVGGRSHRLFEAWDRRLTGHDPTLRRLLSAVREIRAAIVRSHSPTTWEVDRAATLEASFDVCLFATHDLPGLREADHSAASLPGPSSRPVA